MPLRPSGSKYGHYTNDNNNYMKILQKSIGFITLMAVFVACNSSLQTLKSGQKKFDLGEYDLAIKDFEKVIKSDESGINFLIAESYRLSNRLPQASNYYERALAAGNKNQDARFYYAFSLKALGKYEEAKAELEKYVKPSVTNRINLEKAKREFENLKEIGAVINKKTYFEIKPLSSLNTTGAEFSPVLLNDELLFTTARKDLVYKTTGQPMLALYKTKAKATETESPTLFSQNLTRSDVNEGTPTFTKDGKLMVFARGNNGKKKGNTNDVDLYLSRLIDGQWSEPLMIQTISDSLSWEGCPAFSGDNKTLYFCSNRPGGKGGIDIYRVNMDNAGRFGRPTNMGSDINTPGDEMFPYVSPDAKLYFASDGHPGLGRLDLFAATRKDGEITIENIGQPFNSRFDDFGLAMIDKDHGYFSSNREGGKGDDDIYYFENTRPNETPTNPPVAKNDDPNNPNGSGNETKKVVKYFLAGNVQQVKMSNREGINEELKVLLEGVKIKIIDDAENLIAEVESDKMGSFGPFAVKENKEYTIIAEKTDFYTKREAFTMVGKAIPQNKLTKAETDTTYFVNVLMDKPGKGQIINRLFAIESIYYDLNKADIRQDAALELDKVVQILKDNQNIKLELGSHTDARASFKFNVDLSQRRANSAVQYIISRGVAGDRITAKGYGETQLVNRCADGVECSEEEHQQNRRTEFKVLGVE